MDDIVKQAMKKWPNVPDAFGWLGLDTRGHWFLRDAQAQAQGSFASGVAGAKGSAVTLDKLNAFIARNYSCDAQGRWFFQNGPQRVYAELALTPWVLRLQLLGQTLHIQTHTNQAFEATHSCLDEQGRAYLSGPAGLGLVHSNDALVLADALDAGLLPEPEVLHSSELPVRFAFIASPASQL